MKVAKKTKTDVVVIENSLLDNFYHLVEEGIAIPADAPEIALDNYTRLKEGMNRFRLVGKPVYGAEVWFRRERVNEETGEVEMDDQGNPRKESAVVRFRPGAPIIIPGDYKDWGKDKPRRFIALLVYNFDTKRIEVLTCANKSLFESMMGIMRFNEDNMNPFAADFKIEKKHDRKANIGGQIMDIYTYTIRQSRETPVPEEVVDALSKLDFTPNLLALFEGDDPFAQEFEAFEEVTEGSEKANGQAALKAAKKELQPA